MHVRSNLSRAKDLIGDTKTTTTVFTDRVQYRVNVFATLNRRCQSPPVVCYYTVLYIISSGVMFDPRGPFNSTTRCAYMYIILTCIARYSAFIPIYTRIRETAVLRTMYRLHRLYTVRSYRAAEGSIGKSVLLQNTFVDVIKRVDLSQPTISAVVVTVTNRRAMQTTVSAVRALAMCAADARCADFVVQVIRWRRRTQPIGRLYFV